MLIHALAPCDLLCPSETLPCLCPPAVMDTGCPSKPAILLTFLTCFDLLTAYGHRSLIWAAAPFDLTGGLAKVLQVVDEETKTTALVSGGVAALQVAQPSAYLLLTCD